MTAEVIYGSNKHKLYNEVSYSVFHIKLITAKYRHGIRREFGMMKRASL